MIVLLQEEYVIGLQKENSILKIIVTSYFATMGPIPFMEAKLVLIKRYGKHIPL
jgi:hypothetical protein